MSDRSGEIAGPKKVISRLVIPGEEMLPRPGESWLRDRVNLGSFANGDVAKKVFTLTVEKILTPSEVAESVAQISNAAWDRMMRARVKDFS